MSLEIIKSAIAKGAALYPNVSGGKDGQAMAKVIFMHGLPIAGLIHADLGRVEWHESSAMCNKLQKEFQVPLHIVRRSDGRDMIDHWNDRLNKLAGSGKPFWSSSKARYCTSDMKRDPIDKFYRNCGNNLIISCEGIRAGESTSRAAKSPLSIRKRITHDYYLGMTVEQAIEAYDPRYRLALTWYPIFNFTVNDVWQTYGMSDELLLQARVDYIVTGKVPAWWEFHPAYVYGNDRVSCVFCVMGNANDLENGAKHRPELLETMIEMEERGQATFKDKFSLKELRIPETIAA